MYIYIYIWQILFCSGKGFWEIRDCKIEPATFGQTPASDTCAATACPDGLDQESFGNAFGDKTATTSCREKSVRRICASPALAFSKAFHF